MEGRAWRSYSKLQLQPQRCWSHSGMIVKLLWEDGSMLWTTWSYFHGWRFCPCLLSGRMRNLMLWWTILILESTTTFHKLMQESSMMSWRLFVRHFIMPALQILGSIMSPSSVMSHLPSLTYQPTQFPVSSSGKGWRKVVYGMTPSFWQVHYSSLLVCCIWPLVLAWYPEAQHHQLACIHEWLFWWGLCR